MQRCTRLLLASTLGTLATVLRAQTPPSPETNLFGDDIVQKLKVEEIHRAMVTTISSKSSQDEPSRQKGLQHMLFFQDQRQLCGELVSMSDSEIVWRRPDSDDPVRFPRNLVRRIDLVDRPIPTGTRIIADQKESPREATVKLAGADWLSGKLTSSDGETFALQTAAGPAFKIARDQIEWLYFGNGAAPGYSFSGNATDLDGWIGADTAPVKREDGSLAFPNGAALIRPMSPQSRLEVQIEMPKDAESGQCLWLQPYNLSPNSYALGTIELRFSPERIYRTTYFNTFDQKEFAVEAKPSANGRVSYQVLYDGPGNRLVIFRNGRLQGDWKLQENPDSNDSGKAMQTHQIRGISLNRTGFQMMLNRIRVRPWDGIVPDANTPPQSSDRLALHGEKPMEGKLESVSESDLHFSGESKPLAPEALVTLHEERSGMDGADAMVVLHRCGEVGAANVTIEEGKVHAKTSFDPAVELPLASVDSIGLPLHDTSSLAGKDLLIFKNGDELPGTLLSASREQVLNWQMPGGEVIRFHPDRVAGIRFALLPESPDPCGSSMLELRNGDRLFGKFIALEGGKLRFESASLPQIQIDQAAAWKLLPDCHSTVLDGGQSPSAWCAHTVAIDAPAVKSSTQRLAPWRFLDGRFASRATRLPAVSGNLQANLKVPPHEAFDRFELSFDVTNASPGAPGCFISLQNKNRQSLRLTYTYGRLRVYASPLNNNRGAVAGAAAIGVAEQIPEPSSRTNIRLFVDSAAGTVDAYFDGVLITSYGRRGDKLPGIGADIDIQPYQSQSRLTVFSNLHLLPWSGELPIATQEGPKVILANGDVTRGTITEANDKSLLIESEIGPMKVPAETVQSIEFGGESNHPAVAARIHLTDGSTIQADDFHWDQRTLVAHSANLGDVRLPAEALSELILNPPTEPSPHPIVPKNPKAPTDQTALKKAEKVE